MAKKIFTVKDLFSGGEFTKGISEYVGSGFAVKSTSILEGVTVILRSYLLLIL